MWTRQVTCRLRETPPYSSRKRGCAVLWKKLQPPSPLLSPSARRRIPSGRALAVFMFAGAATAEVHAARGANGFVTVRGYDLGTGGRREKTGVKKTGQSS